MGVVIVNAPAVLLYDANGVALAVQDGVAIPANTPAIMVAGSDGTNARYIRVATDGAVRIDPTGTTTQPASLPGTVSAGNSSATPLGSSATFTGTFEDVKDYAALTLSVFADQASATDGLKFDWSHDGTNVDRTEATTVSASSGRAFNILVRARYFRVRYVNDATAQTAFRLGVVYHVTGSGLITKPLDGPVTSENLAQLVQAVLAVKKTDGSYDQPVLTSDGRLFVSSAPITPGGTTPIKQFADGSVGAIATVETVYTVTNGKTLTIQAFRGGSDTSSAGGRVELVSRPTGNPASDVVLDVGYVNGNNFDFAMDEIIIGNGTKQIVLKRINSGGTGLRMGAQWRGYEQ